MKLFSFFLIGCTLAVGLASCGVDEHPVFEAPAADTEHTQSRPIETHDTPSGVAWKGDDNQLVPIRGKVTDNSDNPLDLATVRLTNLDTVGVVYHDTTASDGFFDWDKVLEGNYNITIDRTGYQSISQSLLVDGPDSSLVYVMTP